MTGPTAASEWRAHWPLVLCGMLGVSAPMIAMYALGQFMAPLEREFGWSRTEVTAGLSASLVLGFLASPVIGHLIDRTNVRWLALSGLAALGAAIAAFSQATGNLALWMALWSVHALAGAFVGPTLWLAIISSVFDRGRSLAIAVCLSGTALATGFGPIIARMLRDAYDWRIAFQLLGLVWIAPALGLTFMVLFDRRDHAAARHGRDAGGKPVRGEAKSALASATFVKMAVVVALTGMTGSAYSLHMAPALADKGLGLTEAAMLAGLAGFASVPGKLAAGAMFDRFGVAITAMAIMGAFALACLALSWPSFGTAAAILACSLFGMAVGANFALTAVLVAKLFPTSLFGLVYGSLMSVSAICAAIGPMTISTVYDLTGTYSPSFLAGIAVAVMAALLLCRLSPVATMPARVPTCAAKA